MFLFFNQIQQGYRLVNFYLIILIKINGNDIRFRDTAHGNYESTIEGIRLDRTGVIKEFPELKDDPNWKVEAIKRFKEKLKSLQTEEAIADYIISDLRKFGYIPKWKYKKGFRREAIT